MTESATMSFAGPLQNVFHLERDGTLAVFVVDGRVWDAALRLAALGGWVPAGTTIAAYSGYRFAYAPGETQIDAADATALSAGLTAALDRYVTATPDERLAALYWPQLHPSRATGEKRPWLAPYGWQHGQAVAPFHELDTLFGLERGESPATSRAMAGLHELAEFLSVPAGVALCRGTPRGWIDPAEPTLLVRVRPRAHHLPQRIECEGGDRGSGDVFRCRTQIATPLIATGLLALASDPEPEPVASAPARRSLGARLRHIVGA